MRRVAALTLVLVACPLPTAPEPMTPDLPPHGPCVTQLCYPQPQAA